MRQLLPGSAHPHRWLHAVDHCHERIVNSDITQDALGGFALDTPAHEHVVCAWRDATHVKCACHSVTKRSGVHALCYSAEIKATDFGLSIFFKPRERFNELVGSPYYVAPEVLKKNYSFEVDLWSLGVILYILLSGLPPFWGDTEEQIFKMVLRGKVDFDTEPWPKISSAAKDLVKQLLTMDATKRCACHKVSAHLGSLCRSMASQNGGVHLGTGPAVSADKAQLVTRCVWCRATCSDILRHPWLKQTGHGMDKPLDNVVLTRMKKFAAMNKLKKTALMVVGGCLSAEEIAGMKRLFKTIDEDNSGTITVKELQVCAQFIAQCY